jgi:hypothetical protein
VRKARLFVGLALVVSSLWLAAVPAVAAEGGAAKNHNWELGVLLGEPTGFSAKYWTTWNTAFDFGAAWSFEGKGQFHFHCDYLFHNFDAIKVEQGSLPIYFGVGGRIRLDENDSRLGLRLVIGAEYLFADYPMSLFFEVAPIVDFAPDTEASVNGGLGVRFVF